MSSKMQKPFIEQTCEHCGMGTYQEPYSAQEWHLVCSECEAIKFCYVPMTHQASFHADNHKFKMYAGGYGSAKTSTCAAEIIDHILKTPGGTTLIGAQTIPQLEQTAQKTFFEMFPQEYIEYRSIQKRYIDCINGHRVLFISFDDEGKLRSLNLTAWWIEEASEVKYEVFTQLQTRLRNEHTDKHIGILSTNPDMNWIKTEFLMKSDAIYGSEEEYDIDLLDKNKNFSVHIASTRLNTYLPDDYYESVAINKPDWWIARYLNGSFTNREGNVYPMYQEHIVEPFEIPKHWERTYAIDPGLVDPTAVPFAAIDPGTGTIYFYDEHYENQKTVDYHSKVILEKTKDIPMGLMRQPVADTKMFASSEKDMRSLADHYAEYGLYFKKGTRKLEDSIMKVYGFFELGKIKIFSNCKNMIMEFQNYKYPERSLDDDKTSEKPIDKYNHLMDAIRYLIAELPDDPNELINESYNAFNLINTDKGQTHLPHALQDDEDTYDMSDWSVYY